MAKLVFKQSVKAHGPLVLFLMYLKQIVLIFAGEELTMNIKAEEYLPHVVEQVAFKINVHAHVNETRQTYAGDDDFRLRRVDLDVEVLSNSHMGAIWVKISNVASSTVVGNG